MLTKPANTAYPLHPLLQARWSPRAFVPTLIATEQILSMLEAARWAASGGNVQPWSFLVVPKDDEATFARLFGCLAEGNQVWVQHVPLLLLTVAELQREPGKPNPYALYDLGQAVANLTIQATALGLSVHQMAGFNQEQARSEFAIPEAFAPVTVVAIGLQGEPAALPEPLREREEAERTRKPLRSFVFGSVWGHPTTLLTDASQAA